jgi:hypothetical protein
MDEEKKILVLDRPPYTLMALIPKKRGSGFQKVPIGHNAQKWISTLEDAVQGDVFGLEGCIAVDLTGHRSTEHVADAFREALAKVYAYPVETVDHETFWKNHPLKAGSVDATSSAPRP